jgi:hypothetical protein
MKASKPCIYFVILCCLSFGGTAQTFEWKANLGKVDSAGFYQIPIQPATTALIKSDLSDLRLIDERGKNVPFIVQQKSVAQAAAFVPFPIVGNRTDSNNTTLEVDVNASAGTDYLHLVITNTAVERAASISGSNDRKQWFIIKENLRLINTDDAIGTDRFVQSINYPFNRYRYLKLVIANSKSDPLNILQAGVYRASSGSNRETYLGNPATTFTQNDSNQTTVVHIVNAASYVADRISWRIEGPKFYKRDARIFVQGRDRKGRQFLSSFQVVSGQQQAVSLPSVKSKEYWIEVDNGDNPPLTFSNITTAQLQRSLIAYLDGGTGYYLLAGNPAAAAPRFDLAGFRDSIPAVVPALNYGPLVDTSSSVTAATNDKKWLWPAIIVMVAALGWLTFRLIGDVKRSGV